ncbi:FHA domain-containing protein, partial [Streptomyces sudanensis]
GAPAPAQVSPGAAPPQAFRQPGVGGDDDWVLPPPSRPQAPPPGAQPPHPPQRKEASAASVGRVIPQQPPQEQPRQQPQEQPRHSPPGQPQHSPPGQPQHSPPGQPQHSPPGQPQQTAAPTGWTLVVRPDHEYFTAMMRRSGPEAANLNPPAYAPERRVPLTGQQVTVGRRRPSTGESPDIDLSVPPEDPGVSHRHAVFLRQPDGSWAVVDQSSTNGTTLNGSDEPIQPYVPVPLQDGDRVHVGAWTTITVVRG